MIELRVMLKEEPSVAPEGGMGIRVYIDGTMPAGLDTRQHDQIRLAILGQATMIAQYTIDHELLPGDDLPGGATAEPLFTQAVKLLRAAGAFVGDEDLEVEEEE